MKIETKNMNIIFVECSNCQSSTIGSTNEGEYICRECGTLTFKIWGINKEGVLPEKCQATPNVKTISPVRKKYDCADCGNEFFDDEMEYHDFRGIYSKICEKCTERIDWD